MKTDTPDNMPKEIWVDGVPDDLIGILGEYSVHRHENGCTKYIRADLAEKPAPVDATPCESVGNEYCSKHDRDGKECHVDAEVREAIKACEVAFGTDKPYIHDAPHNFMGMTSKHADILIRAATKNMGEK